MENLLDGKGGIWHPLFIIRIQPEQPGIYMAGYVPYPRNSVCTLKGEGYYERRNRCGISDSREDTDGFRGGCSPWVVALVGLVLAHNASTQAQEIQQALENKVKALQTDSQPNCNDPAA